MVKEGKRTAIILGNGASRLGFDYRKALPDTFVYGCNGAYRENPDALVCTDVYMQHLIYNTGYCKDHLCYFSEWEPLPEDSIAILANSMGSSIITSEQGDRKQAVVSGNQNFVYVTWVMETDKVVSIPEHPISSGSRALLLACESGNFDGIYLLGFDGMGALNVYQQEEGYEKSQPRVEWIKERETIKEQFPNIKFYDL